MHFFKLVLRNTLRHKLRSLLTAVGLVVAVTAFGLLQTVVDAWYAGAEAAAPTRLVTRNSISLVFPLPLTYHDRIRQVPGVAAVSYANWFGGLYITEKNFFPQFAIEPRTYFALYPEFVLPPEQFREFLRDRRGAVVGRKLAQTYGFRVGDTVPIRGTIFPGNWEFVVRGIYDGAEAKTDTSQFFFHWDYVNETMKRITPRRANQVGIYLVGVKSAGEAALVAREIDATFRNSLAETLTETEKAFQLGFVAMTEAIVVAIRIVSFLVIFIIMAVMANTMVMTARERVPEYAMLKALGFGPGWVAGLIFGESVCLALAGGAIGIALTFPVADEFGKAMGTLFPVFNVSAETVAMQAIAVVTVGVVAAAVPTLRALRIRVADGLRNIG